MFFFQNKLIIIKILKWQDLFLIKSVKAYFCYSNGSKLNSCHIYEFNVYFINNLNEISISIDKYLFLYIFSD